MPRPLLLLACSGCYALHPSRGGGQLDRAPPDARDLDPTDVAVPEGYEVEVAARGLVLPTGITFDDAGTPFVVEAGYSYGEVFLTPRLLRVDPDGSTHVIAEGDNGPWTGVDWHDGAFFVAEGGVEHGGRIVRIDPTTGAITPLVDDLPSLGDHHTNGPVVGPDGLLYFGQGTATNAGVVGEDNATFGWLERHPDFHDVPCVDLTIGEARFVTNDVRPGRTGKVETGAFVPYGTPTPPGTIVEGSLKCSGAVYRVATDGSGLERIAYGFRNPFGLGFSPDGQLYVTDNGYDVRGSRPVFGNADWMWKVRPGAWYGWPDYADGVRLGAHRWKAPGHPKPKPILEAPLIEPPEPAARFGVHASADGFDFSTEEAFGHVGEAFVALFGDQAKGTGKVEAPVGFQVVRVNVRTGVVEPFLTNLGKATGPASWLGSSGLERPVAVRFHPSGRSLYVVDFGVLAMEGDTARPVPGTGAVWRIESVLSAVAAGP